MSRKVQFCANQPNLELVKKQGWL